MAISDEDKQFIKTKLLKMKSALIEIEKIGSESAKPVELDQSGMGRLSRMDALQTQALAIEAQGRRKVNVQRVDAALERIEKGTYGQCVRCNQTIGHARLDFDPAILLCINCAKG